jgi:hypothetical protein
MNSIPDLMNYLFERRARCSPPEALADIFERLVWYLDDNGTDLLQERDNWLLSGDKDKVAVALALEETFPFANREKMVRQFQCITERWPELAPRCQEIPKGQEKKIA